MKKAVALILTLVLSLSVFAGTEVFAYEMPEYPYDTEPTGIPFELEGYKFDAPAEDIVFYIDNSLFAFDFAAEMRYHLEDAEGIVETGKIRAGIEYKLICEVITNPGITTEYMKKEYTTLYQWSPYPYIETTASDFHYNGDWFVIVFDLPKLDAVLDSIDFYMEGFQIGTHVDDVVVYSDDERITDCRANFYFGSDIRETGELIGGLKYKTSVFFKLADDVTVVGTSRFKVRLHLPDGKEIISRSINSVEQGVGDNWASFEMENLDKSFTTVTNVEFNCAGFAFGESADDLTVVSNTDGIVVTGIAVECEGVPPTDDNYQEFHGEFRNSTRYRVALSVNASDGYVLHGALPKSSFLLRVENSSIGGALVKYYPSGEGYVIVMTLPIIDYNPTLEPKDAAAFVISGYELGADIDDITVTIDDDEIEIRGVDIRNFDTGEYCTGTIREGIQYEVVITAFAVSGWNINKDTIGNITLNIGTFSGLVIVDMYDIRIMGFKYKLPVFGEIIDDPDDPGGDQYEKISSLDLHLTGYELGNDSKNLSVTCDNEGAVIRKVSVKTPAGEAYSGPIEAGQRYQVTVIVHSRGGWALPNGSLSVIKLDGIAATNGGIETGSSDHSFVYYVYALAAGDGVEKAGDMDGDGEITVSDALRSLRIAAKLDVAVVPKSTRSTILGDVDGDKDITVADSLMILRKAAKLA